MERLLTSVPHGTHTEKPWSTKRIKYGRDKNRDKRRTKDFSAVQTDANSIRKLQLIIVLIDRKSIIFFLFSLSWRSIIHTFAVLTKWSTDRSSRNRREERKKKTRSLRATCFYRFSGHRFFSATIQSKFRIPRVASPGGKKMANLFRESCHSFQGFYASSNVVHYKQKISSISLGNKLINFEGKRDRIYGGKFTGNGRDYEGTTDSQRDSR